MAQAQQREEVHAIDSMDGRVPSGHLCCDTGSAELTYCPHVAITGRYFCYALSLPQPLSIVLFPLLLAADAGFGIT